MQIFFHYKLEQLVHFRTLIPDNLRYELNMSGFYLTFNSSLDQTISVFCSHFSSLSSPSRGFAFGILVLRTYIFSYSYIALEKFYLYEQGTKDRIEGLTEMIYSGLEGYISFNLSSTKTKRVLVECLLSSCWFSSDYYYQ